GRGPVRDWLHAHATGLFSIDPGRSAILAAVLLAAWSGEASAVAFRRSGDPFRRQWSDAFIPFACLAVGLVTVSTLLYMFRSTWQRIVTDNSLLLYALKLQDDHGSLINAPAVRRMLLAFALAGLVLCLSRFYDIRRRHIGMAVMLVMAADLLPWAIRFNPFIDPHLLDLPVRHERLLDLHRDPLYRSAGMDFYGDPRPESAIFPPNTLSLWRIPDFRIYTSTPLESHVRLINRVQSRTYWDRSIHSPVRPLLDLASVKWIYTPPKYHPDMKNLLPAEHLAGMNGYINGSCLSRLRVTGAFPVRPETTETPYGVATAHVWEWLTGDPDRFTDQTLVEPATRGDSGVEAEWMTGVPERAAGRVLSFTALDHRVEAEVETVTPAVTVLSDAFYPGWKAAVNGQPVPVVRANGMFRAIPVPAGRSRVVFQYEPVSYRLGLFLMLVALGSVFLILQQRRRQEE
ncbi:MAG TPA: YfhO family protein, partial [bacterium]|nr:YfhO family protein [bacterium]